MRHVDKINNITGNKLQTENSVCVNAHKYEIKICRTAYFVPIED